MKHQKLFQLFCAFARIGVCTFGGGYAMLPMIRREVVERRGWATDEEVIDYYAVSQCTPGAIAVNTATLIGYRQAGVAGGIVATIGVIAPSFVMIAALAAFFTRFADLPAVRHAFAGVRVCVCALILRAVASLWRAAVVDRATLLLFFAVLAAAFFLPLSPVISVVASAAAGLLIGWWRSRT